MLELCIFGSIAFWGLVGWFWLGYKDSRDQWQPLADELGLEFEWGGPVRCGGVSGTYRGMEVSVRVVGQHHWVPITARDRYGNRVRKLGKAESHGSGHTTYTITSDDLVSGLAIVEEGVAAKLAKLMGGQDVEVGSAPLDDAFVIQADNPSLAREVMRRDGIESALLELRYKTSKIALSDGRLQVKFIRAHSTHEAAAYLEKLTGLMAMLAPVAPILEELPPGETDSPRVSQTAESLPEN